METWCAQPHRRCEASRDASRTSELDVQLGRDDPALQCEVIMCPLANVAVHHRCALSDRFHGPTLGPIRRLSPTRPKQSTLTRFAQLVGMCGAGALCFHGAPSHPRACYFIFTGSFLIHMLRLLLLLLLFASEGQFLSPKTTPGFESGSC